MPAALAARAVGGALDPARAPAASSRFALALARRDDDAEICRLLASSPFPGEVKVSLERAPSPTSAGVIDGDEHQIVLGRDRATGAIAGVASRSVRGLYVNGEVARVGYLGQLRIAAGCRSWRTLLEAGFSFCRRLDDRGAPAFHLTSVVAGNDAARRLIERPPIRSAPAFVRIGRLRTFAIAAPAGGARPWLRRAPSDVWIEEGTDAHLPEIVACLQRNLRRYQLAPHWTPADLGSDRTRGLQPGHFVVAVRGSRVIGCLARWDQTAFKQVVVRGYSPRLSRWRWLVNAASRWTGLPALPPIGAPLRFAYLSHGAVDGDRTDLFSALVREQRRRAGAGGARYLLAAYAPDHPFHVALSRGFRCRTYDSVIYLASWGDAENLARALEGRALQPEVAVL